MLKFSFYCWDCGSKLSKEQVVETREELQCKVCGSFAVDPIQLIPLEVLEKGRLPDQEEADKPLLGEVMAQSE